MTKLVPWNPRRSTPLSRRLPPTLARPFLRPVNNFGDLLGPIIVDRLLAQRGLRNPRSSRRLLTVGSTLHEARDHDVVWGSGRNGKIPDLRHRFDTLDVRAVRGPRTAAWLGSRGVDVPPVFGDPAMLLPQLFPELQVTAAVRSERLTFIPNLNDVGRHEVPAGVRVVSPLGEPFDIIGQILRSRFVVASSLHAVIVAEAFGVECRAVRSPSEPEFKYADHFEGTGRAEFRIADSIEEALSLGGERPPTWDPTPLLDAFPEDLFVST